MGADGESAASSASPGRPMERWCMRRRRRRNKKPPADADGRWPSAACPRGATETGANGSVGCDCFGLDYHQHSYGCNQNSRCDSSTNSDSFGGVGGEEAITFPFSLADPSCPPRPKRVGGGPSEGGGGGASPPRRRRPPDSLAQQRQQQQQRCPCDGSRPPSPLYLATHRQNSRVTVVTYSSRRVGGLERDRPFFGGGIKSFFSSHPIGVWWGASGRRACSDGGAPPASGDGTIVSLSLLLVALVLLSLGAHLVGAASASIMGDGCDWSGSGLMAEMEVPREGGGVGIRPVYLRCSQGAVSWVYPRGALRVLLRLAGGGADDEFRGCVRLGRTWSGARLFLEGIRSLHPLFPGDEDTLEGHAAPKGRAGVRCFQSRKGQAALYVEATPGEASTRGRTLASFEYHLQPLPSGVKSFDPSEECRPCTMEEMTHAFCSSDLVTRGIIRSVESHGDDPETSELKVRVTKLIRRTRAPPPALEGDPSNEDDDKLQEDNGDLFEMVSGNRAVSHHHHHHWWDSGDRGVSITLHVPTHCGAHHGAGEFVFMAQRKLGQLRLHCAPRLEDWVKLARKSNHLAASPCVLQA